MDVSVLIGKPLGALRPSPPITAWEEVNIHAHTHARESVGDPRAGEQPPPCDPVIPSQRDTSL